MEGKGREERKVETPPLSIPAYAPEGITVSATDHITASATPFRAPSVLILL